MGPRRMYGGGPLISTDVRQTLFQILLACELIVFMVFSVCVRRLLLVTHILTISNPFIIYIINMLRFQKSHYTRKSFHLLGCLWQQLGSNSSKMGVSIEEYRQRIGCFVRVLSSFRVRGNNSNLFQKQSKDFGTALRVIIRYVLCLRSTLSWLGTEFKHFSNPDFKCR